MQARSLAREVVTQCLSSDDDKILREIDKHDVISFDLFNTLTVRYVPSSTDVIKIMAPRAARIAGVDPKKFIETRFQCEVQAVTENSPSEATLTEIYNHFSGMTAVQRERLVKLEGEYEINLSAPNRHMLKIYNYCIETGKKTYIISDTPLSRQVIEAILQKNDIKGYAGLYISSEERNRKYSGMLFDTFLEKEGVDPAKQFHIGDSYTSDYKMPRSKSIDAAIIRSLTPDKSLVKVRDTRYYSTHIGHRHLRQFIRLWENENYDEYERIGYEILGPLLLSFSSWIHKYSLQYEKMIFLAREGIILQRAYTTVFPNEKRKCCILRTSRRAITGCSLADVHNIAELFNILKTFETDSLSLEELYQLGYITESTMDRFCKDHSISRNFNLVSNEVSEKVKNDFSTTIIPIINAYAADQNELFKKYYQNTVGDAKRVCYIDVGWRGSMQDRLSELNLIDYEADPEGYYFGISKDSRVKKQGIEHKHGCLFEDSDHISDNNVVRTLTGQIFEMMFMDSEHGTTLNYQLKDHEAIPVMDSSEYRGNTLKQLIKIQDAAFQFINDYISCELKVTGTITCKDAFQQYKDLLVNASNKTVGLFSSFSTFDVHDVPLVSNKSTSYWITHPKDLMKEFDENHNKSLFLKSVFKLPLPYYDVLKKIYVRKSESKN